MKTWRDRELKWLPLSEGTDFESPNTFSEARPEASAALFKVDTLAAANDGAQIDLWEHSHDLYFSVLMLWSLYPDYAKQMSHSCVAKKTDKLYLHRRTYETVQSVTNPHNDPFPQHNKRPVRLSITMSNTGAQTTEVKYSWKSHIREV